MAEAAGGGLWTRRAVFLSVAVGVIFFALLPLDTGAPRWAPPDLLLAFCLAWSARRPDYVPALSIALVALLADLLYQRPPGLFALLTLFGCEYLKNRARTLRDAGFWAEWATVGAVVIAVAVAYRVILALVAVEQPPLGLSLLQALTTVAAYPVVVLASHLLFGLRRPAPTDASPRGLGA